VSIWKSPRQIAKNSNVADQNLNVVAQQNGGESEKEFGPRIISRKGPRFDRLKSAQVFWSTENSRAKADTAKASSASEGRAASSRPLFRVARFRQLNCRRSLSGRRFCEPIGRRIGIAVVFGQ